MYGVIVFTVIFTIICRYAVLLEHGQQRQKKVKIMVKMKSHVV